MFKVFAMFLVIVSLSLYSGCESRWKDLPDTATKGIVAVVQSEIGIYYANRGSYPAQLDSATVGTAGPTNPFFCTVLGGHRGITDPRWSKTSQNTYKASNGSTYIYTPTTGQFVLAVEQPVTEK